MLKGPVRTTYLRSLCKVSFVEQKKKNPELCSSPDLKEIYNEKVTSLACRITDIS